MADKPDPPWHASCERAPQPLASGTPASPRRVTSEELFGDAFEIEIDHRGVLYRLRRTSLGKLILTK